MNKTITQFIGRICLLVILLNFSWQTSIFGQNKEYSSSQENGKNSATILLGAISGGYSSTNNASIANVENPNNAVDADETTFATMKARNVSLLVGSYSGEAWLKLNYSSPVDNNTTTYIKIDEPSTTGFSLDLLETVGGLLGLLDENIIIAEAFNGSTLLNSVHSTISRDENGDVYIAVTPSENYTGIRIKLRSQSNLLGLSLGGGIDMNVYDAFYYTSTNECGRPLMTYYEESGLNIGLLEYQDRNLENAIDADNSSYSTIKTAALLNLNVAGTQSQFFDFGKSASLETSLNLTFSYSSDGLFNTDLIGATELVLYNNEEVVYKRSLMSSLLHNTELLNLIQNGQTHTLTVAPGKYFNRAELRLNNPVGLSILGGALQIYNIERFDASVACVNPNVDPDPSLTDGPLEISSCAVSLGEYSNVDFPQKAVDNNNETYARIHADAGNLLVNGASSGYIELDMGSVSANKTTYVRIGYDEDVLERLLAGSLGELATDIGNSLLLGNQYIQVEVFENGVEVLNEISSDYFGGANGGSDGIVRLVEDNIGRVYLAIKPNVSYDKIRISNHVAAVLPLGKKTSLDIYDACFEIGQNTCFPANFTAFNGEGINLSVADLAHVGVKDPYKAISNNSSEYSEINFGVVALGSKVFQSVFFSQESDAGDKVKIKLMIDPSAVLSLGLLGAYKVKFYNGETQVGNDYSFEDGIINNLDLIALFSSKGIVELEFEPTGTFDRVDIGAETLVGLNTATGALRIYNVERVNNTCTLSTAESPFDITGYANELTSWEHVDMVQNLLDEEDFDSYATLRSNAGPILGINSYSGYVEMKFPQLINAGKTSYVRIDFEEDILNALLSGSLGSIATNLLNNLLLGDHYFDIEVRNDNDIVLAASSKNTPIVGNGDMRIVQDALGRYYIAITPEEDYNIVRITDHTSSLIGLLAQDNQMNVYGLYTELSEDECLKAFGTSYEYQGINLGVDPIGGAGVTNAEYALDANSQHYSEISNGTLGVGASTKQYIYFNTKSDVNDVVEISFKTEGGVVDLDVLGGLEIKAYLGNDEVAELDWQNGIVHGVNVLDLLSNNQMVNLLFQPGQEFDKISVGIKTLLNVSVFPPIHLYGVERCKDITNFVLAVSDINQVPENITALGNVLTNDRGEGLKVVYLSYLNQNNEYEQYVPGGNAVSVYNKDGINAGTIEIDTNGYYSFIPESGFTGTVNMKYGIVDENSLMDAADLTINVIPNLIPNDNNPPVANDDHAIGIKNTVLMGNVLDNDNDPDGDAIRVTEIIVEGITYVVNNNTVVTLSEGVLEIDEEGDFTFTPSANFTGKISTIVYKMCDDGIPEACDNAMLNITIVNYEPGDNITIANDDASIGIEGMILEGNVLDNDFDPEGDTQELTNISINGQSFVINSNSVETINIQNYGVLEISSDGEYSFEPETGFIGTLLVEQVVCDDGTPQACDKATLYLTVMGDPTPLPIKLASFNVEKVNQKAVLEWITTLEEKNKGFEIHRSADGKNWENIGFVESKTDNGNSDYKLSYGFVDNQPMLGANYYRLKQLDFDGNYEFSIVRLVTFTDLTRRVNIYPNPAKDYLIIDGLAKSSKLYITNLNGQVVYSEKVDIDNKRIDLSQFATGMYTIVIETKDGSKQIEKVLITK